VARALGALARRAHDAGLFQDDFAPNNFLLRRAGPPELWLIDFERARMRRRVGRRARRWMLGKLERAFADAGASDRMRFLSAYTGGRRKEIRRWWRELGGFAARLFRRDLARLQRNAVAEGRRFRRLALGGWHGFAAEGIDDERILALLRAPGPPALAGAGPVIDTLEASWRVRYAGLSRAQSRRLWARAHALAGREGLGAEPLALVERGGATTLLLARPPGALRLRPESDLPHAAAAVRALLLRLAAVGEVAPGLPAGALMLAPAAGGGLRAALLDPASFEPARRAWAQRRAAALALAARLLVPRGEAASSPAPAEGPLSARS
jgi:hypothetical protein